MYKCSEKPTLTTRLQCLGLLGCVATDIHLAFGGTWLAHLQERDSPSRHRSLSICAGKLPMSPRACVMLLSLCDSTALSGPGGQIVPYPRGRLRREPAVYRRESVRYQKCWLNSWKPQWQTLLLLQLHCQPYDFASTVFKWKRTICP